MRTQRNGLPAAPDRLLRRMAALDFDVAAVARSEPGAFGDLRTSCANCSCPGRCERDLRDDPAGPMPYCPNGGLLAFLAGMWWLKILL